MLIVLMLMCIEVDHDEREFDFLPKDKCVIYLNRTEGISQLPKARIIRKRYKITKSIYDTIEH